MLGAEALKQISNDPIVLSLFNQISPLHEINPPISNQFPCFFAHVLRQKIAQIFYREFEPFLQTRFFTLNIEFFKSRS